MATDERLFHWADYVVFCSSLCISLIIGVYYAMQSRKKSSTTDYLMGGKDMGVFPVAASFVVSGLSAIFVLGFPSETYAYGIYLLFQMVGHTIALVVSSIFYHPVYHRLGITSVYEYLELRFSKTMRIVCSIVTMTQMVLYSSVALYAPSIALSQAMGLPTWACVLIAGVLCTCYTTLGGLKTVLWTDTVQWVIMVVGLTGILIKGTFDLGGFPNVLHVAKEGGRLTLNKLISLPLERHTIWNWLFGESSLNMVIHAAGQCTVQRVCSVKTISKARLAMLCAVPIHGIMVVLTTLLGCIAYAYYRGCDPHTTGRITSRDQLLALLVMDVFEDYPGMTGVFISSIMSAALSTVSSMQNSCAALFLEDLIKPLKIRLTKKPLTERQAIFTSKMTVLVVGVVILCMALLASHTGKLLMQLGAASFTLASAPTLGVFKLGLFLSFSNTKGAFAGLISGMVILGWIIIGALSITKTVHQQLPVSTHLCSWENITSSGEDQYENTSTIGKNLAYTTDNGLGSKPPTHKGFNISILYQISYTWYSLIGWLSSVIFGMTVSLLTGGWNTRKKVKHELLFSFKIHGPHCCIDKNRERELDTITKEDIRETTKMFEETLT